MKLSTLPGQLDAQEWQYCSVVTFLPKCEMAYF